MGALESRLVLTAALGGAVVTAHPVADAATPPFTSTGLLDALQEDGHVDAQADSKGHLHIAYYTRGDQDDGVPNDLRVGLYSPDGSGDYEISVDATILSSHEGYDDRHPAVAIVESEGATDTTFIFNGTKQGHAFLTELDFAAAVRDGSPSDSATLVQNTYFVPLPLSVQHPEMTVDDSGNLHVVFVGSDLLGGARGFTNNRVDRGVYYLKLSTGGEILAGPIELYRASPPNHPHTHPQLDLDSEANVHGVFRAGSCGWSSQGNVGCNLYYFKLDNSGTAIIPTTEVALSPGYAFDKRPAIGVGPNGNVNLVYAGYQGPKQYGASYDFGRGLQLTVLSTVGNRVTILVDNLELVSPRGNQAPYNFKQPGLAVDSGGNLHVSSHEDEEDNRDYYWIFDPRGNLRFGPHELSEDGTHEDEGRDAPSLSIVGTRVFVTALNDSPDNVGATSFDFGNLGLDLDGGAQIPPAQLRAPTMAHVAPEQARATETVALTIEGTELAGVTSASVGGVALTSVTSLDGNRVVGVLAAGSLEPGVYDVEVTGPGGTATLEGGFQVTQEVRDDGGCACRTAGSSPLGAMLVFLAVFGLVLRRRTRSRGSRAIGALTMMALVSMLPGLAHADIGPVSPSGLGYADSRATTAPALVTRYVGETSYSGTGDGSISPPVLPDVLYDVATATVLVPEETVTVTAQNATTWTVTGSVSGSHPDATTGVPYSMDTGVSFTISVGTTLFTAGDEFTFAITATLAPQTLSNVVEFVPSTGTIWLITNDTVPGYEMNQYPVFDTTYDRSLHVSAHGYISSSSATNPGGSSISRRTPDNEAFPSRRLLTSNQSPVVAPFWDDLVVKDTSRIYAASVSNVFVIEWRDFAHRDDPTASYTFQAVFFQGRALVRFHYLDMQNGSGALADGSSATIGAQQSLDASFTGLNYAVGQSGAVSAGLVVEIGRDQDADGVPLGYELMIGTDPLDATTDNSDSAPTDGAQLVAGLDPLQAGDNPSTDADGDNLLDIEESFRGLSPSTKDSDGDGVDDDVELQNGTNPLAADSDLDGLSDGAEDANGNGAVDGGETDPRVWDSDSDGTSDGFEAGASTDPLDPGSSMFTPLGLYDPLGSGGAQDAALDSKGHMHLVLYARNNASNGTPDDLHVGLYSPDGSGGYQISVASTVISSHTGYDDRYPSVVTVPGDGAVDKTLVFNGTQNGHSFLTEIDFNAAARDGGASDTATLVQNTVFIPLPLSVQHPNMTLGADGNLHIVFVGSDLLGGTDGFSGNRVDRGVYYLRLSQSGQVLAGPVELYRVGPGMAHPHIHPRLAIDADGAIHGVFRAGYCSWTRGNIGCNIHYFKLGADGSVRVPTTQLALAANLAIEKAPDLVLGPNGNINILYSGFYAEGSSSTGGWTYGRDVFLHVISTVDDQIHTLLDQKVIFSAEPQPFAAPFQLLNFRTPSTAADAGGNLHVLSSEVNDTNLVTYSVYSPSGEQLAGPFTIAANPDRMKHWIAISGQRAFIAAGGNGSVRATTFDLSSLELDTSGGGQLDPPALDVTITSVSPDTGREGASVVVIIEGSGFRDSATATIGGIGLVDVTRVDDGKLVGTLATASLEEGSHDVVVSSPNGTATLTDGFTVSPADRGFVDDGCGCRSSAGSASWMAALGLGLLAFMRRRRRRWTNQPESEGAE